MGIKLGNTFVKCDQPDKVVAGVRRILPRWEGKTPSPSSLAPAAFVSASRNGWVGVFEESLEGAIDLAPHLAIALSRELETVAISFHIWDGEYLSYSLAEKGQLLDEFSQHPDYRHESPGQPTLLARTCGLPKLGQNTARMMRSKTADPGDTLAALAGELGLSNAFLSYRYFDSSGGDGSSDLPAVAVHWHEGTGETALRAAEPRERRSAPAGKPHLPLEVVEPAPAGSLAFQSYISTMGHHWRNMMIQEMLRYLYESPWACECTVWTDEALTPPAPWHIYVTTPYEESRAAFLEAIADDFPGVNWQAGCALPAAAVPVAKRLSDGEVIRLWPLPGPKVPAKQRVKIEWVSFTLLNRCYELARQPGEGEDTQD